MEFGKVLLIIESMLKEIKPKVAIASLSSFEENLQEIKKFADEKGYCFNYLKFNDLDIENNNVKLFKFFLEDKCLLNDIRYSVTLRNNLNTKGDNFNPFINRVSCGNKNNNLKDELKNVSKNIKDTVTEVVNSEETLKTKEALKGFCDKVVNESKKIVADIKADKKNDIKKDNTILDEKVLKDIDEFI